MEPWGTPILNFTMVWLGTTDFLQTDGDLLNNLVTTPKGVTSYVAGLQLKG